MVTTYDTSGKVVNTGNYTPTGVEITTDPSGKVISDSSKNNQGTYDPKTNTYKTIATNTDGSDNQSYSRITGQPTVGPVVPTTPQSEGDIYKQKLGESESLIDSINKRYDSTLANLRREGAVNLSETNAANIAGGLMGGADAARDYNKTATANDKVYAANEDERYAAVAGVLSTVEKNAVDEAHYQREQYRLETKDYLDFKDKMISDATNAVKTLSSGGVSLDDYKQKAPDNYSSLVKQLGGDENMLSATWALNRPQNTVLESKTIGSTYYQVVKNPITGAVTTEHFDLGFDVPKDYNAPQVDRTNGVVVWTPKTIDPNKPLEDQVIIKKYGISGANAEIKDLTIQQKKQAITKAAQLTENAKALEATRIVGSQIKADKGIQNFLAISPMMDRIKAAQEDIKTNGINQSNSADLLDAVTQVNTGGKQITEGQISLTKDAQSYQDQLKALGQKLNGQGGVIDPKIANDAITLSTKIFKLYSDAYKKHTAAYNQRLKNVNGEDLTQYSPLTDITNLPALHDGTYEASLKDSVNSNTPDNSSTGDIQTQIEDAGGTDNGDGTYTMPDGSVVSAD